MEIRQQLFTRNDCYRAGRYITPIGIMVHSTGANNPYLRRYLPGDDLIGYNAYGNHWDMSDEEAEARFRKPLERCVHGFIGRDLNDNILVYQTLPWDMRGWHAGGKANDGYISFEICEDDLTDESYFRSVYAAAVSLCAFLCREYNLAPSTVICHAEGAAMGIASDHADVMHWFSRFGVNMDDFRAAVAAELEVTMTVSEAKAIVKEKAKLEDKTIQYIADDYRYGDDLIIKLAEAMK